MNRWRRALACLVGVMMVTTSCSFFGGDDEAAAPSPGGSGAGPVGAASTGIRSRGLLGVRLSQGQSAAPADPAAVVAGTPLSEEEVTAVLNRLPVEPGASPEDTTAFNRPAASLPPPRVGDTLTTPFPPRPDAPDPAPTATDPLEVVRVQPEGEVEVAPYLTVTFNQPMVPLATVDQLDAMDLPIGIDPPVEEGRWRWLGTRTARFEVDPRSADTDRLPAATAYTVTVPAGMTAASGAELADDVTFSFTTPAPQVVTLTGVSDAMILQPVLLARFDQLIDPAAVLPTITLTADGRDQPLDLATTEQVEADEAAAAIARDQAGNGRWVAFRPTSPLPAATAVTVAVGPGTPSIEGPRTSAEAATFTGRTFDRLTVIDQSCNYGGTCVPLAPWTLTFNNPLDPASFDPAAVTVEPTVPGLRVSVNGNQLLITGATKGRTTYTVTLPADLADTFGQRLGSVDGRRFEVGPARPLLAPFPRQYLTTDPMADRPGLTLTTVNHESVAVTAWKVDGDDLTAFQRFLETTWSQTDPGDPAFPEVYREEIAVEGDPDAAVETLVDLSAAFTAAGTGQVVVRVAPTRTFDPNSEDGYNNRPGWAWVQATTLGIDAIVDNRQILVWTTDLVTGQPRPGVEVRLLGTDRTVTTDENGVAKADLSAGVKGLAARDGERTALLPSSWYEGWQPQSVGDETRWYTFDDRGIYKPGETARITGWLRRFTTSGADPQLALYDAGVTLAWRAYDPVGNELGTGTAAVNPLGGFNLSVAVPAGANLGAAYVELTATGPGIVGGATSFGHTFQIQDFRTPEFEVVARPESPGPYVAADPATVAVDAAYYAGGALPDAEVDWTVTTAPTTYRPPAWDRWTFGIWQPWWLYGSGGGGDIAFGGFPPVETEVETFAGRTDGDGHHYLRLDFDGATVDLPTTVRAEAAVSDVNRQVWAAGTDLVVHPARIYVGLRSDRPFVEQGTPLRVDTVVTDIDGAAVAGRPVEVTAGRLEATWSNGTWTEELVDPVTCTVTSVDLTPGDAPPEASRCEFATDLGGQYRITAVVTDNDGHRNRSELTLWVTGAEARPSRLVEQEAVTLVPDAETYAPGDTAEVLVQAPFAPAHGLVTILRGGVVSEQSIDAPDGSAVVRIPIEDPWIPGVTVQVDMVGTAPRLGDDGTPQPDAPPRPAFATGQVALKIPPATRALQVTAAPADPALTPGADTSVTVTVADPAGNPVAGADVALVVVDEAVLSLTGYQLADPLEVFYTDVYANVFAEYTRAGIVLNRADLVLAGAASSTQDAAEAASGEDTATAGAAPATTMADLDRDDVSGKRRSLAAAAAPEVAAEGGTGSPIAVRSNFDAVAVYAPDRSTGIDGTVTVEVPLPDNLTRYRVMAVAVDGARRFGRGESTITARLPLMVRPSAPRFLNFGDRFELPVVVQNQTDTAMDVAVALEPSNLTLTAGAGRRVTVPANDRVEVRFPVAADDAGTARFRVAAVDGPVATGTADAAAVELPVYTPATAEAFATYGVIDASGGDGAVAQPLIAPDGVFPQFGGLEIDTSSTAVQSLTDAVLYLADYPYESADGYASRIMAIAALRDVLDAFDADGLPPAAALNRQVERDLTRLAALQNEDGGFPWFQRGQRSVPWTTIQATHALILARDAGYPVPADTLDRALTRLTDIEALFQLDGAPSPEYGTEVRDTLTAYALNVRYQAGTTGGADRSKADALYQRAGDDLPLDALAWLWPVVSDGAATAIGRTITNRATDTAGAVTFTTGWTEDAYLIAASDRRTDGIVLDALLRQAPDSELIPKVVAGLMAGQTRGRWHNALENGFILVAMKRYFDTFEAATPDFVARAWLGDTYAAEHRFQGRTTDRAATLVPMADVIAGGDQPVVVAKDGPGRLYYRLSLRYAPDDLTLEPRDEGFVVERIYEAADPTSPDDVTRDDDGTWHIRAGATVRVNLTLVADAARTHVALIDPLPAGLEPLNPGLAVSPTPPPLPPADRSDGGPQARPAIGWCWCWQWYEHQNLRDDRAEAFTSYLPGGTYSYSYTARATTPGTFVVPPTRAEEMYAPETFGRAASALVVVQ